MPALLGRWKAEKYVKNNIKFSDGGQMYKKRILYSLFAMLLAFALLGCLEEIKTGSLQGKIYDSETDLLIEDGVTVSIDGLPALVTGGEYLLEGLLPGSKTLLIKAVGYNNSTVTTEVTAGEITTKDVYLEKERVLEPGGLAGDIFEQGTNDPIRSMVKVELLGDKKYKCNTEEGHYRFEGVVPGRYGLRLSADGYNTVYENVDILEGVIGTKDITMSAACG